MIDNFNETCKQCKIGMVSISGENEIIDKTIDLLERYKHGYYGYFTSTL